MDSEIREDLQSFLREKFLQAIREHDPVVVKELLSIGFDPNEPILQQHQYSNEYESLLSQVLKQRRLSPKNLDANYEIIRLLLVAGASPNKYETKNLSLILSHIQTLDYLHLSDSKLENVNGEKSIEYVMKVVDLLLKYNADPNAKAPLEVCIEDFPDIFPQKLILLQKLLEAGATATVLLTALNIRKILNVGPIRDPSQMVLDWPEIVLLTLLKYSYPFVDWIQYFLDEYINKIEDLEYLQLKEAIHDYQYFSKQLPQRMFNYQTRKTNLMMVCEHGFIVLVQKYLTMMNPEKIKSIINYQDIDGNTALHYAVMHDNPTIIIHELLKYGANPFLFNKAGKTPLYYLSSNSPEFPIIYQTSIIQKLSHDLMIKFLNQPDCLFHWLPQDVHKLIRDLL